MRVNGDYVHAPLTALGKEQAAQTGTYLLEQGLSIDGFYASPLRRAQETARIIGSKIGKTPETKNGVQEIQGIEVPALAFFEALTILDPVEDYLEAHADKPIRWPIEGRVAKALMEIVQAHLNQRIVVVAHTGTISAALAWAFPDQRLKWWRTTVNNCSLTRLSVDLTQITLVAYDEMPHLSPQMTPIEPPDRAVQLTKQVTSAVTRPEKAARHR